MKKFSLYLSALLSILLLISCTNRRDIIPDPADRSSVPLQIAMAIANVEKDRVFVVGEKFMPPGGIGAVNEACLVKISDHLTDLDYNITRTFEESDDNVSCMYKKGAENVLYLTSEKRNITAILTKYNDNGVVLLRYCME